MDDEEPVDPEAVREEVLDLDKLREARAAVDELAAASADTRLLVEELGPAGELWARHADLRNHGWRLGNLSQTLGLWIDRLTPEQEETVPEIPPVQEGGVVMTRPDPPDREPPTGLAWRAIRSSATWQPTSQGRCRGGAGPGRRACGAPAVLELRRVHHGFPGGRWWKYCQPCGYGHWVEDGQVWEWVLRGPEDPDDYL